MACFQHVLWRFIVVCFICVTFNVHALSEQKYSIYIDADFSGAVASSQSIKQGINTALAEINYQIQGITFEIVVKNHRANSLRSKRNLEEFLTNEDALMVFSGLHSPPLLANKSFINNNRILLLDPWAAAGPITRSTDNENWIFRLSIDDSNAGTFISDQALKQGFKKPFLLLEDTGWGRSNEKTMNMALEKASIEGNGLSWFNWGIGKNHAKVMLRNIKESGADVIFFVGNAREGSTFTTAMTELPAELRLPIRSHWGITGGDFTATIPAEQRKKVDLQFIQTNFSFLTEKLSPFAQQVLNVAIDNNTAINNANDIKAPTGFVHGYDLTKIVIAAINQVKLTGNRKQDKTAIHYALEHLKQPVHGLLKTYQQPFAEYNKMKSNAHEALGLYDYSMGYYNDQGETVLLETISH